MDVRDALERDVVLLADSHITFVYGVVYRVTDIFLAVNDVDHAPSRICIVARNDSENVVIKIGFPAVRFQLFGRFRNIFDERIGRFIGCLLAGVTARGKEIHREC